MHKKISLLSLTILVVSAIDSIRTLPVTALFGFSLIFYYLLTALVFLIPVALISAEFSSRYSNTGGIFHWIKDAYGSKVGLLAVWLQWINTMVWYPTMLLFISGTASYLISAHLSINKFFLLGVSLGVFWILTFLNLKGTKTSVKLNSYCAIFGTLVPMCLLICLGVYWVIKSHTIAINFSWEALSPALDLRANGNAVVTIIASFLGMELAGVHVNDIENPGKNFPKALAYSVLILLTTLILGSLSIALVIPKNDIQFVDGIMQTFTILLSAFNIPYVLPILAILIILGATGGAVNWILSPAKGLMQAAEEGFLPSYFLAKNQHGATYRILILQALVVTCFSCALHFVQSINTYYWFLMALSTSLYVLMYILLFSAALKLKRPKTGYVIPKGLRTVSCITGILACLTTIFFGFQPAPGVLIESGASYVLMIVIGFTLMLSPVVILWQYKKRRKRAQA